MTLVIELTKDEDILRVMLNGKEVDYSVKYIACPTDIECDHDMCNGRGYWATTNTRGEEE